MDLTISEVVNILKPLSRDVFSGKSTLSLSTNYLEKLNNFIENLNDSMESFHIADKVSKASRIVDYQFVLSLFQKTVKLKIYPDMPDGLTHINITRFTNIKSLEILRIDINNLIGLQKLRSQLQELICCNSLHQISDALMKCGGDNSQAYSWNELKLAKFSHNNIVEIDNSFDWTLSLHTLDISHNKLARVNIINQLPNLKCLNISYNKLTKVPHFKGPICHRLQILVLNNNFIEDLTGLVSLVNIVQLDLNQNSLLEHGAFWTISHLVSLQYLNVENNPLNFHKNHRNLVCNYLNKNASTLNFLLDNVSLSKSERKYVGLYSTVPQAQTGNPFPDEGLNSLTNSMIEKPRKIRNVKIEDKNEEGLKVVVPKFSPNVSSEHLQLKKQVEQLRQEFGELWLHRHAGSHVEDVLGFEKSLLSSTPVESNIINVYGQNQEPDKSSETNFETANNTWTTNAQSTTQEEFNTATESVAISSQNEHESISDSSDGEDVYTSGEQHIYLVTNRSDDTQVFVVVTDKCISERNVSTSKEIARWHINTIVKCEKIEECTVKLEFNTLRRDRKFRIYEIDPNEMEAFYIAITEKIDTSQLDEEKKKYQCMKCSKVFKKLVQNTFAAEAAIECPVCDSNLVIES